MSRSQYRAWRFVHPDFDLTQPASGLRISNTGGIAMVDAEASVRQAILLLLSTRPGERVMRPTYGCDLHRLVFSPNDDTTAGLAIHYVRQALDRWEPRVDVIRLDAGREAPLRTPGATVLERPHSDAARLEIYLEYRLRATQQTESFTYVFALMGEQS